MMISDTPFSCRLVKPEDLNPANTLFGGRVLEWLDEVAALYTIRTLKRERIVTAKITEVNFKAPARVGDYLDFYCDVKEAGNSSITIHAQIYKRKIAGGEGQLLLNCQFVFVAVDENGKSTPHGFKVSS